MTAAPKPISAARQRWLDARKRGIGGSEIAAVAGLDPDRSAIDIYNQKLGLVPAEPENLLMRAGKELEPLIFRRFAEVTGRKVVRWPQTRLARSAGPNSWQQCTPDAEWFDADEKGTLEAKAHGYEVFAEAKDVGLQARYIAQLQWALGIRGRRRGSYAILCRSTWEFLHFDVDFDPELFAQLTEAGRAFMARLKAKEPPPIPPVPLVFIKPVPSGKDAPTVALNGEDADRRIGLVLEARKNRQEAEEAEAMTKAHLIELLTGGYNVYANPRATVRWEQKPGRVTLSEAALLSHQPIALKTVLDSVKALVGNSMDRDALISALTEPGARLNLDLCRQVGQPFEQLSVYERKGKAT